MAKFVTSRPFSGVRQIKFEQLLETNPDWVAQVSERELEDYLYALEKRYQDRCHQLVEENWEKVLAADPTVQGTAEAITVGETISARAREIAMSELLEA